MMIVLVMIYVFMMKINVIM